MTDVTPADSVVRAARAAGLELIVVPDRDTFDRTVATRRARGDEVTTFDSSRRVRRRRSVVARRRCSSALAGLIVRWLVLRSPAGVLTADEAYTGIQSFEILGGQFPIVLGGTAYTLPFEAYLYAPIAAVFGTNIVDAQAAVSTAVVGRRFGGGRRSARAGWSAVDAGAIAATLCWLTPGALLLISVTAYSAYASGLRGDRRCVRRCAAWSSTRDEPRRWPMFAFGVLAGFGFWLHPMFLATLVPMVLVVLWVHRRRLVRLGAGRSAAASSDACRCWLWNAKNAWPSLDTPAETSRAPTSNASARSATDLLPRAFGLRDLDSGLAAERCRRAR